MLKATVSLKEARQIVLFAQGLAKRNQFGLSITGAKAAIEHLGYVQIDTISVVERAHNHVWWSRVNDYEPSNLSKLLANRDVFEYWSHAASYLPMRDFRFSLPRKRLFATGKREWFAASTENKALKKNIMARVRAEGPLGARNFASDTGAKRSGWWDWKPAKRALEQLFMEGHLMVSERRGFAKIYDLSERVLPAKVDTRHPSPAEYARHLIVTAARSHGFVRVEEIAYQRSPLAELVTKECAKMLRDGELEEVSVEGIDRPYLALAGAWQNSLIESLDMRLHVLSPFDNQVIQRKRLKELFSFDYTIECYVPEAKRQFGYFCLPLLQAGRFVGRIDCKADRREKRLDVRALHIEPGCGRKSEFWRMSQDELKEFAAFNGCGEVERSF